MAQLETMDEFLVKINALKEKSGVDLSVAEDLSIAVMNLVSLEEHFFFTGVKTKKDGYFDTAQEIRALRKELLEKLMSGHEGETWCISKHLLGTTMRLIEVGTKLHAEQKKDEAKRMFEKAYTTYSIFWALKLKLISGRKVKETAQREQSFEDLLGKLANCCDE